MCVSVYVCVRAVLGGSVCFLFLTSRLQERRNEERVREEARRKVVRVMPTHSCGLLSVCV